MKKHAPFLIFAAIATFLIGCAASTSIDRTSVSSRLINGKTTLADATALFGSPLLTCARQSNGSQKVVFSENDGGFVGMGPGGDVVQLRSGCVAVFDKRNFLVSSTSEDISVVNGVVKSIGGKPAR